MQRADLSTVSLDPTTDSLLRPFRGSGNIQEWLIVDQFHDRFDKLLKTEGGPRSFCGVACGVIASVAAAVIRSVELCGDQVNEHTVRRHVLPAVADLGDFTRRATAGLRRLAAMRKQYCDESTSFHDKARKQYMNSWVANYEVSALAAAAALPDAQIDGMGAILFIRANQFPMLSCATHEEKIWIEAEESRFGGVVRDGAPRYDDSPASRGVLIDTLTRTAPAELMSLDEYFEQRLAQGSLPQSSSCSNAMLCIVDQQGHYTAHLFIASGRGTGTTFILNTLATRTATDPIPAMSLVAHDVCCAIHFRKTMPPPAGSKLAPIDLE